jgi:hypothetical protein
MQNTIVHNEGATSLEGAVGKVKLSGWVIKLGLDIHAKQYVVVAQYDQLLPKAARRFWPGQFVPWVESLLRQGHTVHVVYEACGFGFGLYRELRAAGAQCYVIAPRKLDEQRTGVKTDPRDATTLCQRLSRYPTCHAAAGAAGASPAEARGAGAQFVDIVTVYLRRPTGGRSKLGLGWANIYQGGSRRVWRLLDLRC